MLISKERYIARLFSVMLGYDIAEKLYNLNSKLYIKSGVLLDIRLPSLYHVLVPSSQASEGGSCSDGGIVKQPQAVRQDEDQTQANENPGHPQHLQPHQQGPRNTFSDEPQDLQPDHYHQRWASEPEMISGEDSTSLVLEDFADVAGSLMDYGSERDYLR